MTVGADLRRRVKVVAGSDVERRTLAERVERDDGVDGFARARRVVFAHRDDATAVSVDDHVSMPDVCLGRNGARRSALLEAVQALVGEVGEEDGAVFDPVASATVLMNTVAGVETFR